MSRSLMPSVFVSVLGLIGAIVVAFGGYSVARATNSGRISTTTAATLWAESTAMRKELRDQVEAQGVEISRLNLDCEERSTVVADLRDRLAATESVVAILQSKIVALEKGPL